MRSAPLVRFSGARTSHSNVLVHEVSKPLRVTMTSWTHRRPYSTLLYLLVRWKGLWLQRRTALVCVDTLGRFALDALRRRDGRDHAYQPRARARKSVLNVAHYFRLASSNGCATNRICAPRPVQNERRAGQTALGQSQLRRPGHSRRAIGTLGPRGRARCANRSRETRRTSSSSSPRR